MTATISPRFDLEGFESLEVRYDADDDIAVFHFDAPQAAVTWEVGDSWYIRVADEEVVGIELHGLRRGFLSRKRYAQLFRDALVELAERSDTEDLERGFDVRGSIDELPKTSHLMIFLVGQAIEKLDAAMRHEYADTGRSLFGEASAGD